MGKAGSKLRFVTRPVKNYNVEDRAFKVISKDKPTPAPHYPSFDKIMDKIKSDPNLLNKGKPSEDEMNRLSQVYVKSTGDNPVIEPKQRKLPLDRHTHEEYEFGYYEPHIIPKGKLTLQQALELLNKYSTNPETYTPEQAAKEYNLELENVQNIIEYFKPFNLYIPERYKQPEPSQMKHLANVIGKQFRIPDDRKKSEKS